MMMPESKAEKVMKRKHSRQLVLLVFLLLYNFLLGEVLTMRSQASILKESTCQNRSFREQFLFPALYDEIAKKEEMEDCLTATMLKGNFQPQEIFTDFSIYQRFKPKEYILLRDSYSAVWSDLEVFPIPVRNDRPISEEISYENTFGTARSFGGNRTHEGCDLFGTVKAAGFYPVISMTEGVVEKIGWLPLGGYRIGIRATHGGYFYYAHLASYERNFQPGETVSSGDILGYMGDTGYGKEGTTGRFPVHLHLGIYITTLEGRELSVNPYHVLKAMEKKTRKYTY